MTITSIAASGDFAQTNDCPLDPESLAVGAACTINVTFTPTEPGLRTGELTVAAAGKSYTSNLAGGGQVYLPIIVASP